MHSTNIFAVYKSTKNKETDLQVEFTQSVVPKYYRIFSLKFNILVQ